MDQPAGPQEGAKRGEVVSADNPPTTEEVLADWARTVAPMEEIERRLHIATKADALKGILDDPSNLQKKRDAIMRLAKPNASEDLVKMILAGQ